MSPLRRPILLVILATCLLIAAGCEDDGGSGGEGTRPLWDTYARTLDRTGYNAEESVITRDSVGGLVVKWRFDTGGPVSASPAVANVDIGGEPARLVIAGSYDGYVYAVYADSGPAPGASRAGTEAWRFQVKPHPGVAYGAVVSSAAVADVDGERRVYVGGGETMYALDAATGEKRWEFDAGTGCTTCDDDTERNEILSSPAVLPEEDLVLFGMDVDDSPPGRGGFYALSAQDGRLRWFFDLESGATCRPDADENIRRFDGHHAAEALGLPEDFFSTRDGCDFDRTETACANVWSPVSVDRERELIYFSSSNCDTDDDPASAPPSPPMPKYDEALVVLHYDGTPAWTWRPREVDNDDLAFGAAPNLFVAAIEGKDREVVGLPGKDGTYYLLDRDGENELTGEIEPYWQRNVTEGGPIGGVTGTAAVADGVIYFATAISEGDHAWALDATDGSVLWSKPEAPFYGGASAAPGVVFFGGVDTKLRALDAATGEQLWSMETKNLLFSTAAIVDGEVYVGTGFGALGAGPEQAQEAAEAPGGIWAFCVEGEGCINAGS